MNLESNQATELPRGVDIGVGYFDLPGQKFPKGFYKIRTFADAKQPGQIKGKVQIINDKNEIAGELPATVVVRSMAVAAADRSRSTTISICTGVACNIGGANESGIGGSYWHCTHTFWGTVCYGIGIAQVAISF